MKRYRAVQTMKISGPGIDAEGQATARRVLVAAGAEIGEADIHPGCLSACLAAGLVVPAAEAPAPAPEAQPAPPAPPVPEKPKAPKKSK